MPAAPPHRPPSALWAYAISAAATMLWVGCVLPSGTLADPSLLEDFRTPIHRAPVLLVPGLLLMIVAPVAATIARTANGLRAILAATDAFVCAYAAIALLVLDVCPGTMFKVLDATLAVLALLSLADVYRWTRFSRPGTSPRSVGVRLAVATLVLLTPSWFLVQRGCELASILAPFAFVTISAAGVRLARTLAGLRLTAAVLHLAIAGHLAITLRYTIYDAGPALVRVGPGGLAVLGAVAGVLLLAGLQLLAHLRHARRADRPTTAEALAEEIADRMDDGGEGPSAVLEGS